MRSKTYVLLCLLPCLAFTSLRSDKFDIIIQEIPTGIILDSMNNEVYLVTESGKPLYYRSHIFTPVCNTGECLPVHININWDLTGTFRNFDFSDGHILTKLDHVPFSPGDYRLLDEILRGLDPRVDDLSIHPNPPNQGSISQRERSEGSPASPAPAQAKIVKTKYEMVDGITGATLPEQRAKFVPGALYTCYTLWGLANDHRAKMYNYALDNLLRENVQHLLERSELKCQDFVLDELAKERTGHYAKIETIMAILDTTDGLANVAILDRVYYHHLVLNFVKSSLDRKFYASTPPNDPNNLVKKRILTLWTYNEIDDQTLGKLTTTLHKSGDLFSQTLTVFKIHPLWPSGLTDELLHQIDMIKDQNLRKEIFNVVYDNKANISEDEWANAKRIKKKYGW